MSMDAQVLPPPREVGRWGFLLMTILLGFGGSLIGLAAFAEETYQMGPFIVQLSAKPASSGSTELAIAPHITGLKPGYAKADTHAGFLAFRATVVDLRRPPRLDLAAPRAETPKLLFDSLKDEGRAAGRALAIRAGIATIAGGAAGGALMALFGIRPRRIFEGALAGTLLVALLAVVAWQTYDFNKFTGTTFKPAPVAAIRAP